MWTLYVTFLFFSRPCWISLAIAGASLDEVFCFAIAPQVLDFLAFGVFTARYCVIGVLFKASLSDQNCTEFLYIDIFDALERIVGCICVGESSLLTGESKSGRESSYSFSWPYSSC